ncbi:MAG: C/D box methylation guide ribonucleoprotein complex aNOP56 subunit [Candidatus Lokiarchaeota archaeon]|nr:C/D box methylation guide ribonucleoprotein complex aNOP56 subunit [Candidatus Lokiarchaeota archaeon]
MSISIIVNVFGIFAFSGKDDLIEHYLFGNDVDKIASKIMALQDGEVIEELDILINKLNFYEEISVELDLCGKNIKEIYPHKIRIESPNDLGMYFRKNPDQFYNKLNKSEEEFINLSREVATKITRMRVKETAEGESGKDKLLIQAIETLDNLDKSINLFVERIREWYGLHYPELGPKLQNHQTYLKFAQLKRDEMNESNLKRLFSWDKDVLNEHMIQARGSMGSDLSLEDFRPIKKYATIIQDLFLFRDQLTVYIDQIVSEITPNARVLISPNIIARLISHAGGLMELASKPSSTIQILGAEKALFRSLKSGANPPKHGVIFQDDKINSAKWWLRGKIARLVAAKLTMAIRIDAFGGKYLGDTLKEDLEIQISKIEEKYKDPPKKKKAPQKPLDKKRKRRRKDKGKMSKNDKGKTRKP